MVRDFDGICPGNTHLLNKQADVLELLTPAEMGEADRLTIALGTSGFTLMQAAGQAVAEAAWRTKGEGDVLVVAGPGNNGGDGFVAAASLRRAGRRVRVALLGDRDSLSGDAALAAADYEGWLEQIGPETSYEAGLVIDALFGAGLTRDLDGVAAQSVRAMNASGVPILAVDLPSGIDGRTGEMRGVAIRAARTITFFRLKPGHLLLPGRIHCGDVEVAQIGIPESVLAAIGPSSFHNLPALWRGRLRTPAPDDHKYARGHVFVVSGPAHSTGAARLAAAGALRIGAGAVTVASRADALPGNAAPLTAIMVRRFEDTEDLGRLLAGPRPTAVVIGPGNGVGPATRANVEAALASPAAAVLDADALTSWKDAGEALFARIATRTAPVVMTPHEGEFARLFRMEGSRIDRARAAAKMSGAIIVLKGYDTIIAAPDGRVAVNSNATPDLATAGSGDVLSGMIAGLLAQAMPAFEAACAAVWIHAEAGRGIGRGLIAEDLPPAIPAVLRRLDRLASH